MTSINSVVLRQYRHWDCSSPLWLFVLVTLKYNGVLWIRMSDAMRFFNGAYKIHPVLCRFENTRHGFLRKWGLYVIYSTKYELNTSLNTKYMNTNTKYYYKISHTVSHTKDDVEVERSIVVSKPIFSILQANSQVRLHQRVSAAYDVCLVWQRL